MIADINRTRDLIEPEQRWQLLGALFTMLLTAILQMGGIASVMPFIGLVADPEIIHSNSWMAWAYERSGAQTTTQFLVLLGTFAVVFLAIMNAFSAFSRWLSLRFVWDTHDRLSRRLLRKYLDEPYSFYLNRNSAELSRSLLADVRSVVDNCVLPAMDVLAKGITVALFVALLLFVDPVLAGLAAGTLSGAYAIIYVTTRRKQKELGEQRHIAFGDRFQIAGEAFGGIKEMKVSGVEPYFLARFSQSSARYSRAITSHSIISELPRFLLETVAFGGVIGATIYLLQTRETLAHVLPILALYALAGYRLIPALQSIFASLIGIRFHSPALRALHRDLYREPDPEAAPPVSDEAGDTANFAPDVLGLEEAIRFRGVTFHYADTRRPALRNINVDLRRNQTIGLVGATGSGKTTFVDLILGLFQPTEGMILIDDIRLTPGNVAAWKRNVAYVPQSIFLSDSTITHNIAFGVPDDRIDPAAVERAARAAQLHDFVMALPLGYETIVGERGVRLSGGERQRVAVARALYRDTNVLVMDEATSALDGATEESVMDAIHGLSGKKTIIIIAHRLTTVRDCDVIYMFEDGALVAEGTYASLVRDNIRFRTMAREADPGSEPSVIAK
jgi:ATP-binding cassette, subfamily B, bacterial PglK